MLSVRETKRCVCLAQMPQIKEKLLKLGKSENEKKQKTNQIHVSTAGHEIRIRYEWAYQEKFQGLKNLLIEC